MLLNVIYFHSNSAGVGAEITFWVDSVGRCVIWMFVFINIKMVNWCILTKKIKIYVLDLNCNFIIY